VTSGSQFIRVAREAGLVCGTRILMLLFFFTTLFRSLARVYAEEATPSPLSWKPDLSPTRLRVLSPVLTKLEMRILTHKLSLNRDVISFL
jgi:hypothetical protein